MTRLRLENGSRVAIIGGGPAGALSAYFLRKYSENHGFSLEINIFDGKDFLKEGPKGCNLCAGVIAESLSLSLEREGIRLPEERILSRLDGYVLHSGGNLLELTAQDGSLGTIATVFRGNGPRYTQFPDAISFDDYLLTFARDNGAEVVSHPISDIRFPHDPSLPLQLFVQKGEENVFEAELVIGAFGVNTQLAERIESKGFGYKRPATLMTYQTELRLSQDGLLKQLGRNIHVYLPSSRFLRYITLTPKGEFITLTAVGQRGLNQKCLPYLVREAFSEEAISWKTPACACFPRIVTSSAARPYTDRMVMVGDAGYSRYYKNGIESAFITAGLAAETAVCRGIDAGSFAEFYHRPARKNISRDNDYGRVLFFANDVISRFPLFRGIHMQLAAAANEGRSAQKIRWILWNMFTGNAPYKDIFLAVFDPGLQVSLLREFLKTTFGRIKNLLVGSSFPEE